MRHLLTALAALCITLPAIAAGHRYTTATITQASNDTTTGEIQLRPGECIVAIGIPATFTAATLGYTSSPVSGGTFKTAQSGSGTAWIASDSAGGDLDGSEWIDLTLDGNEICGAIYVKLVTSNAQAADRTFDLILAKD